MPGMSLFGNSGDKIQNTDNRSYQDSFNQSYSSVDSMSDVGNVALNFNQPSATPAGQIQMLAPFILAGLVLVGGVWLLKRN